MPVPSWLRLVYQVVEGRREQKHSDISQEIGKAQKFKTQVPQASHPSKKLITKWKLKEKNEYLKNY